MCKPNQEIKFCTCLAEGDKMDWKLTRKGKYRSMRSYGIMGKIAIDPNAAQKKDLFAQIQVALTNNTLFDIENFQPEEGDFLEVFGLAALAYENKKWIKKTKYGFFDDKVMVITNSGSEVLVGKINCQGDETV